MPDRLTNLPRESRAETLFIHADADYFRTKARQCYRMARNTDDATARTLRSLADAFEAKARSLEEH
jgi:hypothetical protein